MRGICVCAVLTVLLAPAVPARAADRALMADAFKDLQLGGDLWDERAILSAVLARPAESAAKDAAEGLEYVLESELGGGV